MKKIDCSGKRVLIIPDMHAPYHSKHALSFLSAVKKAYLEPNSIIVNLGDEIDSHAISFHDSDSDLYAAGEELEKASNTLQGLEQIFPKMYICDSNHGSLAVRRFKHHGIPMKYLRPMKDVYGVGSGWHWHEDLLLKTRLGNVYVCHGKASGYGKLAKEMGCSAIQGHFHGKAEVTWHKTVLQEIFNMFCGCLIDRESMAFAYGKNHLPKPILGCGLISNSGYPRFIKMELNEKGEWTGQLP